MSRAYSLYLLGIVSKGGGECEAVGRVGGPGRIRAGLALKACRGFPIVT